MIAVSFKTKVFKDVMPLTLKAYEKNKNDPKLIEGLARLHFYLGNRSDSIKFFKTLYKIKPEKIEGRFPFVSSLNYSSGVSQEEYMKECLNFASLVEKKLKVDDDKFEFTHEKNKKIKLAFLSADFKTHSVSHFLKDLLKKIDRNSFELVLISNLDIIDQDDLSQTLKTLSDEWYDIATYTDENLTTFLRSLKLDILIDLSGFTYGNRFEVLARRCAKIQIGWLGYNNSLGIKNLDYLIADNNLIKPNEVNLYSEKVIFLPSIWNSLSPPEILPDIKKDSEFLKDNFVFCSFNNFQKISDRTVNVWAQILKNDKTKLLLKNSLIGGEDIKNNVLKKILSKGIKEEQIVFLEREKIS